MRTHFRRCHLCLTVNNGDEQLVDRCTSCGKYLRTFLFFDEKQALGLEKSLLDAQEPSSSRSSLLKMHYPPVQGLTVYWEED